MATDDAGRMLGRYELLLPVASGGMGTVWAARVKGTRGFQKLVAVKTMLARLASDPEFETQFMAEATLASQVHHPHVVEVLDVGEDNGVLFQVMEWIDGVPLGQLTKTAHKSGGVPLPIAVRIIGQACAGLHAAHELRGPDGQLVGLVHRDISPQNLLVTFGGVAKLVDFGIAKATAMADSPTAGGVIKGKIAYMAPEQARGEPVDRRADVFALGLLLYTLTTGRHPFRGETEGATISRISSRNGAARPSSLVSGYPAELERVVLEAVAKDADARFPTANAFLRALDRALPASERATDEDVASFMTALLGDERERWNVKLRAAIKAADERVGAPVVVDADGLVRLLEGRMPLVEPGSGSHRSDSVMRSVQLPTLSPTAAPQRSRKALFIAGGTLVGGALFVALLVALLSLGSRRAGESDVEPGTAVAVSPTAPSGAISVAPEASRPAASAATNITDASVEAAPILVLDEAGAKKPAEPGPRPTATPPGAKPAGQAKPDDWRLKSGL